MENREQIIENNDEEKNRNLEIDFESLLLASKDIENEIRQKYPKEQAEQEFAELREYFSENTENKNALLKNLITRISEIFQVKIKDELWLESFSDWISIVFKDEKIKEKYSFEDLGPTKVVAGYNKKRDTIELNKRLLDEYKDVDPLLTMEQLSSNGHHFYTEAIKHEKIHQLQHKKSGSFFDKLRNFRKNKKDEIILTETQPRISAGEEKTKELIRAFGKFYLGDIYTRIFDLVGISKTDIDKVIVASQQIKRLYAFGFNDEQIAEMVKKSKWEKETLVYDILEKNINDKMKEKDIELEDVDNLVLAQEIRDKIKHENIQLITRREVDKFYQENINNIKRIHNTQERKEKIPKYKIFIGGKDLEMEGIKELLKQNGIETVDYNIEWGAKASTYKEQIAQAINGGYMPVLIELEMDIEIPSKAIIIDHHGNRHKESASILQVCKLLNIEPTREIQLIAANDAGWIPALRKFGATEQEIEEIRRKDRIAQGFTEELEKISQTLFNNAELHNDLGLAVILSSPINKFAGIKDRMALKGVYQIFIQAENGELEFQGDGEICAKLFEKYNGWAGGEELGKKNGMAFWGGYSKETDKILHFIKEELR